MKIAFNFHKLDPIVRKLRYFHYMKKQKSCYIQQVVSPFFMIYSVSCLLWESIYLLIGRPRPPRFTSEAIGYRPHSYNITWTTDSYEPISEYKLLYRRSDVRYCSLSVFRFQCYPLSFFTKQSWQHCTTYLCNWFWNADFRLF